MAALEISDVDFKRGALKVTRLQRKKRSADILAIGKDLAWHLREYV